jgi:hypothetical protein
MLMICLSINVFADTEIINSRFSRVSNFEIDDISYDFFFSESSDSGNFESKYNRVIVKKGECEIKGYYKYCIPYVNLTEGLDIVDIKVTRFDCFSYILDNGSYSCKNKIGEFCESDRDCQESKCINHICNFKSSYCGDKYCNLEESLSNCNLDCNSKIEKLSSNIFKIDIDQDWVKINYDFKQNKTYHFIVNGSYLLDQKASTILGSSKKVDFLPCKNKNYGSIVLKLCDTCFSFENDVYINGSEILSDGCDIKLRLNDYYLENDFGTYNLTISETSVLNIDDEYSSNNSTLSSNNENPDIQSSSEIINLNELENDNNNLDQIEKNDLIIENLATNEQFDDSYPEKVNIDENNNNEFREDLSISDDDFNYKKTSSKKGKNPMVLIFFVILPSFLLIVIIYSKQKAKSELKKKIENQKQKEYDYLNNKDKSFDDEILH